MASLLLLLQLLQLQNNFEPRGVRLLLEVGVEDGGELFGSMGWESLHSVIWGEDMKERDE